MPTKYCRDCDRTLPESSFTKNVRTKDGLAFYCAECSRARVIASRRKRFGPPKHRGAYRPNDVSRDMKWCPECDQILPLDAFARNRAARNGLGTYCLPCHNKIVAEHRAKNGGSRNYHLRRRYGIDVADYDAMFKAQGGLCAICREAPAAHVDHDHVTGKVRGLLCFNCNGALGQFRERADLMVNAVLYLHPERFGSMVAEPGVRFGVTAYIGPESGGPPFDDVTPAAAG